MDVFGTNKHKPTLIHPFTFSTVNEIAINTRSIWYSVALIQFNNIKEFFLRNSTEQTGPYDEKVKFGRMNSFHFYSLTFF
jgi:hypothetical protein